jgi:hypothetical protein
MNSDLKQLEHWRNNISKLSSELLEVLDNTLPGWRNSPEPVKTHNVAISIVHRCMERANRHDGYVLPKWTKTNHKSSEEQRRESHDYNILFTWSKNIDKLEHDTVNYLDYHIVGWRNMVNYYELRKAKQIAERISYSGLI